MFYTLEFDQLPEFLLHLLEETQDEKLYEAWKLGPMMEKSFEDWKKEVTRQIKLKSRTPEEVEREALEASEKVYKFLDGKGG